MQSPMYVTMGVAAACGIWLLWDVALKGLFLDIFRERLFELRFQLFELGISNEISYDSDTYRTMETLLNGVLRFGHRFTFMSYLLSLREQSRFQKDKDYVNFGQYIDLKISRTKPETQEKLHKLMREVQNAIIAYMGLTSLLFVIVAVVAALLRLFKLVSFSARKEVSLVLENEAYREAAKDPNLATA